jgi:hypothetical protein
MNCREALSQLAKDRDAAPEAGDCSDLAGHLAHCRSCRQVGANLEAALASWRTEAAQTAVPDPDQEWLAVRRRLRGAAASRDPAPGWSFKPAWLILPLAAAIAAVLYLPRTAAPEMRPGPGALVARANSVDVPGGKSSTMVFVDDQSGWLIVWASDAGGE